MFVSGGVGTLFFSVSNALIDFGSREVPRDAISTLRRTGGGKMRICVSAKHPGRVVGGLNRVRRLVSNCVATGNTHYFIRSALIDRRTVLPSSIGGVVRTTSESGCPTVIMDRDHFTVCRCASRICRVFYGKLKMSDDIFIASLGHLNSRTVLRIAPFYAMRRRTLLVPALRGYASNE